MSELAKQLVICGITSIRKASTSLRFILMTSFSVDSNVSLTTLIKRIYVNQICDTTAIRTCATHYCFICCFILDNFTWIFVITLWPWVSLLLRNHWNNAQYYFRSNLVEFIFIAGSVIFSWFIPYLYALSSGLISRNCYIKNQALIQGLRIAFGHFVRVSSRVHEGNCFENKF